MTEDMATDQRANEVTTEEQSLVGVSSGTPNWRARVTHSAEFGSAVAAVVLYFLFAVITAGNGFTSLAGTASWLNTASQLGIIAVPVGLLMIAGEFDLSIGSMVGAASITVGIVVGYYHDSILLALVIALLLAVVVGAINAALVTRTGLPSFIVTLAANLILGGLAVAIPDTLTQSSQIPVNVTGPWQQVFSGQAGQFDVSILWWLGLLVVAAWILTRHRFGNWILATGGNAEHARRAGIPTGKVKYGLFVTTAVASALVGVIQTIGFNTGDGTSGQGYVFQAPIVVVIGGVLLTGGYGSVLGVLLGTIIYGFVSAGFFYTGWDTNYTNVVIGVLMVVAVLANDSIRRVALRAASRRKEMS